jgi:raffinose/stachyose/melibiose transport system substrate-binding protein
MKKASLAICIMLSVILAFSGCSAKTNTTSVAKTKLSVWLDTMGAQQTAYAAKFNDKYPNIEATFSYYESQDYKTQVSVALAGGTAPDILETNVGTDFTNYVSQGDVMDITAEADAKKWRDRSYPDYINDLTVSSKLYGLPIAGVNLWEALFTNDDFFTKNNIKEPTTIDEMVQTCIAIKAKGLQPIAWGNKDGWPGMLMFGDFILQEAAPADILKLNTGEVKWTDFAPAKEAIDAMAKLASAGCFTVGYSSQDHEAAIQEWAAGKAAYLYNGTWWPSVVKTTDVPFKIGSISLPLISSDTALKGTQFWDSMAMFIYSKTKVKDAAVDFLDYYTSSDMAQIEGKEDQCFTTNPTVNKTVDLFAAFKTDAFTKQYNLPKINYFDHIFAQTVTTALEPQLEKVMDGQTTTDKALAAIETVQAEALSK